jgi:eukaryotic-like serine/threonine-protein kinase
MMTTTQGGFLQRLIYSQLLEPDQLAACQIAAGGKEEALIQRLQDQGHLTRFQIRQLKAGATNFRIGKYVITDCVGRGGNGIVFKARHRLMQRFVALKTVDTRNLHQANEAVARFTREIEIVSRLEHPNVVRALDVLQTRTHTYLVLEFVDGQDLGAVVKERGPLPVDEAIDYAIQIATGLQYAHSQGVIHRDLKPANLLLTVDGVVKLSDLGLARLYEGGHDSRLTMEGLCLGTPEYMAPEQAEDAHSAGPLSDIYSLGATLFHLLTGQLPVKGNSYLHRLQLLLTAPPQPLLSARPDAPPELAALVDQMRERDPASRPASATAVIESLRAFAKPAPALEGEALSAFRKADLVMQVLTGQVTADAICAQERIAQKVFERWCQQFVEAGIKAIEG